jgi:hypothetical protein
LSRDVYPLHSFPTFADAAYSHPSYSVKENMRIMTAPKHHPEKIGSILRETADTKNDNKQILKRGCDIMLID